MTYTYRTKGTCSRQITVDLDENNVIQKVLFLGGCNGNTQGVAALAQGMKVQEYLNRCKGIHCGARPTSCPDQLAQALSQAVEDGRITL